MPDRLPPPGRIKSVQIEPTTDCNLKCAGCNRTYREEKGTLDVKNMSLATFAAVIGNLPPGDICWMNGYGEPTLNPALPDMIRVAKTKFDEVYCISNALTRGTDFYLKMEAAGLDQLHLSVDSLNREVAEKVRFGTSTNKLRRRLGEIRAALELPIIVNLVVSKKNLYDVPNTLYELNLIGEFRVGFAEFGAFAEDGYDYGAWFTDAESKEIFNAMLAPLFDRLTNLSFINKGFSTRNRKRLSLRCDRPFLHPAVTVDGLLTPCCVELHDPGHYQMTNVIMMPFDEAWKSKPVSSWIEAYIEEEPEICKECCLNPNRGSGTERKPFWDLFSARAQ